jgi:DNA-binding transcriptional regulator YhcF (GntR family)
MQRAIKENRTTSSGREAKLNVLRYQWRVDRFKNVYVKAAVCRLAALRVNPWSMEKSRSQKKRVSIAGMHIDRASAVPIYLQIAAHLRNAILQGSLPAGTQFLGPREIARELGCSRTVILTAWDLLYAEGYLESTPRGGVTVASVKQAQVNLAPAAFASGAASTAIEIGPSPIAGGPCWHSNTTPTGNLNSAPVRQTSPVFRSRNGRGCCGRPGKIR